MAKRSRRGRQLRAVQLRMEGLSLREIGRALGCSYQTVANDLRDVARVSNLPVKNRHSDMQEFDSKVDSAKIIQFRREA